MRFWDTSALVPLLCEEPISAASRRLLRADPSVVVWTLTRTEMVSAVRRQQRDGRLEPSAVAVAMRRIEAMARRWSEVEAVAATRDRAERLLATHPLTAADALQLGAALVLVEDRPKRQVFVTADDNLARIADAEGFVTLVPRS
jgi:predicted nucleic acid-binding protein